MEPIAVAGLWAGLNLGLMLLLGLNASRVRIQTNVGVGSGGNDRLERAISGNVVSWAIFGLASVRLVYLALNYSA